MLTEIRDIALVLLFAKGFGSILERIGISKSVGEILAGLFVSYFVVSVSQSSAINVVADLGLLFLVLITLMSMDISTLNKNIEKYVFSQIITAGLGIFIIASFFSFLGINTSLSLILLASLIGSSTAIALRSLTNLDALNTEDAKNILSLQVVNSVVELLLFSIVVNFLSTGTFDINILIKLVLILIGIFTIASRYGTYVINFILRILQKFKMEEVLLAFTILLAFTLGAFTETLGLTSLIGAMLVGILFSKSAASSLLSSKIKELGESFFIPIFFASLGFSASFFIDYKKFLLLFFGLLAFRFVTYYLPQRIIGFSHRESVKIASGFISMSSYCLVILGLALKKGIFGQEVYSLFALSYVLINTISPLLIKLSFKLLPSRPKRIRIKA
jgi:Kef-type K+ transport system membrane component KefB